MLMAEVSIGMLVKGRREVEHFAKRSPARVKVHGKVKASWSQRVPRNRSGLTELRRNFYLPSPHRRILFRPRRISNLRTMQ